MGVDGVTSGKEDFQPADHFLLTYDRIGGATIPDHAGYYVDGSKAIPSKVGCCRQLLAPCQGPTVQRPFPTSHGSVPQHRLSLQLLLRDNYIFTYVQLRALDTV